MSSNYYFMTVILLKNGVDIQFLLMQIRGFLVRAAEVKKNNFPKTWGCQERQQ